jgi:hypothetical protein
MLVVGRGRKRLEKHIKNTPNISKMRKKTYAQSKKRGEGSKR